MPIAYVADLVAALRTSRVLTTTQLNDVLRDLVPQVSEPRALARRLIDKGWLTAFQANQLIQGRGADLTLGQYVLLERLGEGGMGQVYKARHTKLGRVVALKVIRKERLGNPEAVRRFYREVQAAAQLNHPNVVLAYDADSIGETYFCAMEYVEGIDLSRLVKSQGPVPVREACDYVRQAALGLQHAHERGLVHRDIKPSNLLLSTAGHRRSPVSHGQGQTVAEDPEQRAKGKEPRAIVKVLDLGLARLNMPEGEGGSSTSLTREGVVMGTPDFISPEQASNSHQADVRSDLYSLGCTFYYLLAGRPPFPEGAFLEKLLKHRLDEPTPVEELRPETPSEVAAIVRRLMAKHPDDRYQTPAELAHDLGCVLDGVTLPDTAPEFSPDHQTVVAVQPSMAPADPLAETTGPWSGVCMPSTAEDLRAPKRQRRQGRQVERWQLLALIAGAGFLVLTGLVLLIYLFSSRTPEPTARKAADQQPAEDAAMVAFRPLANRFRDRSADPEALRQDLLAFRLRYPGTPSALKANEHLMGLPSPLDKLDRKRIPSDEVFDWQPKELVAILGDPGWQHWGGVGRLAFGPEGKTIIGLSGHVVHVWDVSTGKAKAIYLGHPATVACAALTADGRTLALAGGPNNNWSVRLWNTVAGTEVLTLNGQGPVPKGLALSPDAKTLASGSNLEVQVWGVDEKKVVRTLKGHTLEVRAVAFSPDGKWLASGGIVGGKPGEIKLWDLATEKELAKASAHTGEIIPLTFSADGQMLASSGWDGSIRLWELPTLAKAKTLQGQGGTVTFSADGRTLASFGRGEPQFWDAATAEERPGLKVGKASSLAFSADGRIVAAGYSSGAVRLWDTASGMPVESNAGGHGPVGQVAFSPNGDAVVTAGGNPHAHEGETHEVAIWDLNTGKKRLTLTGHKTKVCCLAYSPDGRLVAGGTWDSVIKLWDAATGAEQGTLLGHELQVRSLAFSPDGKLLASGAGHIANPGTPGVVKLWDVAELREVATLLDHTGPVRGVAFSPDGKTLASVSEDKTVRLWDVTTAKSTRVLGGLAQFPCHVAFSPSGQTLASASTSGEGIQLWRPETGTPGMRLEGHSGFSYPIVFATDGRSVFSAGEDGRLLRQEVVSGNKIWERRLPGPVYSLTLSSDGRHVATANANGTVYVLRLAPLAR